MKLTHDEGSHAPSQSKLSRAFNGVWIPASLWLRKDVTWFQKCLLAEIASFETCFASNAYIAEAMNSTEGCIAKEISNLRKKGLILDLGNDGRKRMIVVAREAHPNPSGITERSTQGLPYGKGAVYPAVNIETSVESSRDTNLSKGVRRRTSAAEKDRLLRLVEVPKNAPTDQELAQILSRFPVVQKWKPSQFWALKGTKFHIFRNNRWVPVRCVSSLIAKLEQKLIRQGMTV